MTQVTMSPIENPDSFPLFINCHHWSHIAVSQSTTVPVLPCESTASFTFPVVQLCPLTFEQDL